MQRRLSILLLSFSFFVVIAAVVDIFVASRFYQDLKVVFLFVLWKFYAFAFIIAFPSTSSVGSRAKET